jgi:hypothetical protein
VALTPPTVENNLLSRQWRCTYTLADTPDLVVEGEARYVIESGVIKAIEEEATAESIQAVDEWMKKYADKLSA